MSKQRDFKRSKFFDNMGHPIVEKKVYSRKKRYPYKLYIPENLDFDEMLNEVNPAFRYDRDYFIYILHLIVSIPVRLKNYDIEKSRGFTPIQKSTLSRRVHNYRQYIEFLKEMGIVEEARYYSKIKHIARGLKYAQKYRTSVKGVYITKNTLIKSITERTDNRDIKAERKLHFLKAWFNPNLTIDLDKALRFLELDKEETMRKLRAERAKHPRRRYHVSIEDIANLGYAMKFIVVDKIHDGRFHSLSVDKTSGRFHTPLTQLKKELRKYVRYNGEKLCAVDIVNSQPLLALTVLDYDLFRKNGINKSISHYNENHHEFRDMDRLSIFRNPSSTMLVNLLKKCGQRKDVQFFRKAVIEGKFYEFFADLLIENGLLPIEICTNTDKIRNFAKTAIFTAFFSRRKDAKWNEHIKAFRRCFPNVARIFDLIKYGKDSHNTLALLLQKFESDLVLHEACEEINRLYPYIPLFTVHDSIVTTERNVKIVKEIFSKHLKLRLGIEPQLKIEEW